ncbi:BLUF domain-containing protein [Sphingomonas sp. GB1N7]|uniref:BLUF domain-containing protein n=1 Tax=Parasphingomonas caseinilytica TaxID=3096158 RepID=UPI002FC9691C
MVEEENPMLRLLYISTARNPHDQIEVENILRVSRRNNLSANVTGLLMAGGKRFLQVLEGPEENVKATYDRICLDPRHFAAVALNRQICDERLFPGWSMGYQPPGHGCIDARLVALIEPISDPTVKAYFSEFVDRHSA